METFGEFTKIADSLGLNVWDPTLLESCIPDPGVTDRAGKFGFNKIGEQYLQGDEDLPILQSVCMVAHVQNGV